MEPYLADLINNNKVPKFIRYTIVIVSTILIEYISIYVGITSEILWGKILGFTVAIVYLLVSIILIIRIYKSSNKTNEINNKMVEK